MKMAFAAPLLAMAIAAPLSLPAIAHAQPTSTTAPHVATHALKMDIQAGESLAALVRYTGDTGSLKALKRRAGQGDVVAQYELATLLQTGYPGQEAEPTQALLAMIKLIQHGLGQAPAVLKSAVLLHSAEIIYGRSNYRQQARHLVHIAYRLTARDETKFGRSLHRQASLMLDGMDLKL